MPDTDPQDKGPSLRSAVVGFAVFVAAALAFLNGVPQFVDETLPWLGQRIPLGGIVTTIWDLGAFLLGAVSAAASAVALLAERRADERLRQRLAGYTMTFDGKFVPRAEPQMPQHAVAAVGGTTVTCTCGWRGPGQEYEGHKVKES